MLNPPLDLHLSNIGSAMPQIADQDPERVVQYHHRSTCTFRLEKSLLTCLYPRFVQYAYCLL